MGLIDDTKKGYITINLRRTSEKYGLGRVYLFIFYFIIFFLALIHIMFLMFHFMVYAKNERKIKGFP